MKYLKRFETRDVLRGKDRTKIEEDINGILVELSDMKISYRISWVGNWTNGIIIYIDKNITGGLHSSIFNNDSFDFKSYKFNVSDVRDYLLTIEDYFKEYWGNLDVRYDLMTLSLGNEDVVSYDNLNIDKSINKITMEIKREQD